MKLRTTYNSVRIRIRKSELQILSRAGKIEETISFPGSTLLKYSLAINDKEECIKATFRDHQILVTLPKDQAQDWIQTDQVGIESHLELENKEHLHILIEKDFPCLDRPEEDKSDTFWELAAEKSSNC